MINETIILGIDPGSRITGYGVIKLTGTAMTCLESGTVVACQGSMGMRLQKIYQGLRRIADLYQPNEAAIEKVFSHLNPGGALVLGQARGVAFLSLAEAGIKKIEEYTARQVKQAVVGYGAASKEQVRFMVKSLLGLAEHIAIDNVTEQKILKHKENENQNSHGAIILKNKRKQSSDMPLDATDALAIAVCHAHNRNYLKNITKLESSSNQQLQALLKQYPNGWRRGRR